MDLKEYLIIFMLIAIIIKIGKKKEKFEEEIIRAPTPDPALEANPDPNIGKIIVRPMGPDRTFVGIYDRNGNEIQGAYGDPHTQEPYIVIRQFNYYGNTNLLLSKDITYSDGTIRKIIVNQPPVEEAPPVSQPAPSQQPPVSQPAPSQQPPASRPVGMPAPKPKKRGFFKRLFGKK
jgi:hypothetical protein